MSIPPRSPLPNFRSSFPFAGQVHPRVETGAAGGAGRGEPGRFAFAYGFDAGFDPAFGLVGFALAVRVGEAGGPVSAIRCPGWMT